MPRYLIFFIALSFAVSTSAQEKLSRKEKRAAKREASYQETIQLLESQNFVFIAQRANPQGGGLIDLSTHNADIVIQGDSATCFLPYFGRAYAVPPGTMDGGIKFTRKEMLEYTLEKDSVKQRVFCKFKVQTRQDLYEFTLSGSSLQAASLTVIMINKQAITFSGYLQAEREEEK